MSDNLTESHEILLDLKSEDKWSVVFWRIRGQ